MSYSILSKQGELSGSDFTYDDWDTYVYSPVICADPAGGYRMFYTGYEATSYNDPPEYGPCTATSNDLVTWTKPNVGIITWDGNTNNNKIVFHGDMLMSDVIWDGSQYVGVFHRDLPTRQAMIYTSADGEAWVWQQNVFTSITHGGYVEVKSIHYDSGTYYIYYAEGHGTERRSIGYYTGTVLDESFTDQGVLSEWTSTDQDLQYYDIKTWFYGGDLWAAVVVYNKTSEVLGPIRLYYSNDSGVTWDRRNNLINMGASGEFDDGLIAVGRPIFYSGEWHLMYVGSEDTHDIWTRPMSFAWAIGEEINLMGAENLTFHAPFYQSKSLVPTLGPTLDITRATDATYWDSAGVLQTASSGAARFDHDPANGNASLGLLIEEARTNLCLQSEDFGTTWTADGMNFVANVGVAPDGTTTMDRAAPDIANNRHRFYQQLVTAAATYHGVSCFVKNDDVGYVGLSLLGATNDWCTVVFDLTDGSVSQVSEGATSGDVTTSGIQDCGGGIYRIWMVAAVATANAFAILQAHSSSTPTIDSGGGEAFLGVASEQFECWGYDVEAGAFPTSYIPTVASSGSRNADVIKTTDMSWYSQGAGTMYINAERFYDGVAALPFVWQLSDNSNSDRIALTSQTAGRAAFAIRALNSNGATSTASSTSWPENTFKHIVTAWEALSGSAAHYIAGSSQTVSGDTVDSPVNISDFNVGCQWNEANVMSGHLYEMRFYAERLDNSALEDMSNGIFPTSASLDGILYPRDSMPTDEARFHTFIDDSGITKTGDLTRDYRAALHSVAGLSGNDIDLDLQETFKRYFDGL